MSAVGSGIVFLSAAVLAVPIFKKLKLGAILGYLVAGALIGPSVLNLISDPETILHVAEFGVVLLLFLIGLELEPAKLWKMRNQVVFAGGGQLLITAAVIALSLIVVIGLNWPVALVIALALGLSSTAFAIQLMTEHRILKNPPGQVGFAMLLMQDLAVIPILLLVEALSTTSDASASPWWVSLGAIVAVLLIGRFLLNPFLRLVTTYGSAEVMTASSLLIVLATAMGMEAAGLSMGMGAFVAGILLANSSFRHQLETEIAPFKGLLLGLFFIAIGMNLDLALFQNQPLLILGCASALVLVKAAIIALLMRAHKQSFRDAVRVGLMLSQGGEFAFVVMTQAAGNGLIDASLASQVTLIVGVSMAMTAPLVIAHSQWFSSRNCPKVYDTHADNDEPEVVIAGFGRFGQITGRILAANDIPFTALDKNAEHIEFVKKFGNKVFYGDASRLDLLRSAGIAHARILLLALDSEEDSLKVAELVRHEYPHIRIIVRAHNRFSVRQYWQLGIDKGVRELMGSSLEAAQMVLEEYGYSSGKAEHMVGLFRSHDVEMLERSKEIHGDMPALIDHSVHSRQRLAGLFKQDKEDIASSN